MIYIKELKHHTKKEILGKLDNNEEILNKLIKNNFIKEENEQYYFNYVGVIIIGNIVIKVYPKYVPDSETENNIKNHFKQVIKVIKKDKSSNKTKLENKESSDPSFNLLSLMLFFLEDYYENGLYTNMEDILEINGNGEIHWDRTINNYTPILNNNQPYYVELETKSKIKDIYDYYRLLHEYIITQCSKYLEKQELLDLFGLTPIELTDKTLEDFGEKTIILEKIRKELNIVFNTHKRKILQSMYSLLSENNPFNQENYITTYGTNTFYNTWENICCNVLNDKRYKPLGKLKLPTKLNEKYDANMELINLIQKPIWNIEDKDYLPNKTLIPDLITIHKDKFAIFDAKYYIYKTKNNIIENQPGIGSVTKQYLYELAYKEFVEDHEFKEVKNGFLFPKYTGGIEIKGYVQLNMLTDMNLKNIQIILLPVIEIYDYYLKNKRIILN